MAPRMLSIIRLNSSSECTGLLGMWMRPKWLVTPRGRMASNSGCTQVLVDGAITPNFLRKPSASVMARKIAADPGRKTMLVSSWLALGAEGEGVCQARRLLPAVRRHARILISGKERAMLRTGKEHLESL